jgi:hypothetical protein
MNGFIAQSGTGRRYPASQRSKEARRAWVLINRFRVTGRNRFLSRRRTAHRRRVDGSGERDGSLQCGAACSTEAPAAMLSQACCRQRKLKCPESASESGKIVKVLLHG